MTKLENGESGLRVDGGVCQREKNLNLRANDDKQTVRVESREMLLFYARLKYCLI